MKKSASRKAFEVFNVIFMILLSVVMLYPFLYVASCSVSSSASIQAGRVGLIPEGFNIDAYRAIIGYKVIWRSYGNTIYYTVLGTAINLIMTMLGAYPLSRSDFYGRGVFTVIIAITMYFSGGLIPTFLTINALGMYDTVWAIVLPGAISTMNMIIMRTFFQGIPDALEEAAIIDGASDMQVLIRIILPLSVPSIMTIGMFYAVGHWNSWFPPLIYFRTSTKYPLQLVLRQIVIENNTNELEAMQQGMYIEDETKMNSSAETLKYAVIMVSAIPILCVYPFVQKYFVKGVMIGSIKG
ncbi:MAG: carbohydrate ABC transporter permease [Firmicutes bacterium]|nr:carbohydrate ABC transporter permease [Bacillota bacterium]